MKGFLHYTRLKLLNLSGSWPDIQMLAGCIWTACLKIIRPRPSMTINKVFHSSTPYMFWSTAGIALSYLTFNLTFLSLESSFENVKIDCYWSSFIPKKKKIKCAGKHLGIKTSNSQLTGICYGSLKINLFSKKIK